MVITAFVISFILIGFFILLQYAKSKCNTKRKATFIKCIKYGWGLCHQYAPVFKYDIDGKDYELQTFQSFPKKYVKDFIYGEKYDILIWEEKPATYIINKKIYGNEIVVLVLGLFFLICGILLCFI